MLRSNSRWIVQETSEEKAESLAEQLNVTPLVASLLLNRGIDNEQMARFFLFDEGQQFHDPFLIADMEIAVERIKEAIVNNERILIYGDYDCDGVSSTVLLLETLEQIGAKVDYYIPNRFTEGYGPNEAAFRKAAEEGFTLIITVDTGIAAVAETDLANELGIDVIITDHHEPQENLPNALAIIHPNLQGSSYPFSKLAGVGVALKLAHALLGEINDDLLELAAIGTVADLVSLTGENRLIVKRGLESLVETSRTGIKSLCKLANINLNELNEETIGFGIGPRLNAVGRLRQADLAVELLLTDQIDKADEIAQQIELLNRERQALVNDITEEASELAEIELANNKDVIVIAKEGWHEGVIGIVASRLVERFYRPVIVLAIDKKTNRAKGSGRSIDKFDLFSNLTKLSDLLIHFGGHPMAAGLTLLEDDLDEFRTSLSNLAKQQLSDDDFIPEVDVDTIVSLDEVTIKTIEQLNLLAPFGMDNPKPTVLIKDVNISSIRKIGTHKNHLKMILEKEGNDLDVIGFFKGHLYENISPNSQLSVIGELSVNEWNNIKKPQLLLEDLAVDEWQLFDLRGMNKFQQLNEIVPEENRKWVVFQKDTVEKLNIEESEDLYYINDIEVAQQFDFTGNIIIADLPPSLEMFQNLIKGKQLERVYTYFYKKNSDFFSTMPTRDHFKWYYAFLHKNKSFNLRKYSDDLAKHRGWSRETIDFMSQVFLDLQFVTISDGMINLLEDVPKRDLSQSPTYRSKQDQFLLEKKLLYSSYDDLKNLFDNNSEQVSNCQEVTQ